MKTYSAQSGYVYQYYFAGQRAVNRCVEYVFQVSADRKTESAVSVFVEEAFIEAWISGNGRDLRGSHRYAIAKMALRNALDERPRSQALEEIRPGAAEVAAILEELDA
jgi:hypothetical protein